MLACGGPHKPEIASRPVCADYRVADSANADVAHRAGQDADAAHCFEQAIADLQIAIAAAPEHRDYLIDLCRIYVDAWRDQDALACQQRALSFTPP